jgi:hypothetical protein
MCVRLYVCVDLDARLSKACYTSQCQLLLLLLLLTFASAASHCCSHCPYCCQVYVAPCQWSLPLNLPNEWLGIFAVAAALTVSSLLPSLLLLPGVCCSVPVEPTTQLACASG